MNIQEIIKRLAEEGYEGCYTTDGKNIHVPGRGEVELAYGEAKVFDAKYPWPGYGDHECTKDIEVLFADIRATWPIKEKEDDRRIGITERTEGSHEEPAHPAGECEVRRVADQGIDAVPVRVEGPSGDGVPIRGRPGKQPRKEKSPKVREAAVDAGPNQ